jgi:hypothetical protein
MPFGRPLPPARAVLAAALLALPLPVAAQAWTYPAMQVPTTSTRDYTGALVGTSGTAVLFQWREGTSRDMHLGLDAGLADPNSSDLLAFVGGSLGKQLVRSRADLPIDLLLTAGIGAAFGGDFSVFRVPVGVSVGHRFKIDDTMAFTPFVHPRASLDLSTARRGPRDERRSDSELSLDFDLGVDFELNRNVSFRIAGLFSGSDFGGDGFALGLVFRPNGLVRMR